MPTLHVLDIKGDDVLLPQLTLTATWHRLPNIDYGRLSVSRRCRSYLQDLNKSEEQHYTKLRGPPRQSLLFGLIRVLRNAEDPGLLYEQWASEYGSVYSFPAFLGEQRLVLYDPKAVAHFYGKEGFGYIKTPISRMFIEILVFFF